MKAIILAAGYGVRLEDELKMLKSENPKKYETVRSFIEGKAKPMIAVAGKPVVQHIVENIERSDADIDGIFIVTNNRYFRQFDEWRKGYKGKIRIKFINDGTNTNETRLGAVNDLLLVLNEEEIDDDVLVVAGDNIFRFELSELVDFFNEKHASVITVYKEGDIERIKKCSCVKFDDDSLVVNFEEKPKKPSSEWLCPPVYIYTADTIKLIKEMKFDKDKKDFIGNIPMLLYSKISIYALAKEEKIRFDLGTVDDFEKADIYFREKGSKKTEQ